MSVIKEIRVALHEGGLRIGKTQVNALRKYFNNAQRNPRESIDAMQAQFIKRGPFPLAPIFQTESIDWMRKLLLKKDGEPRDTIVARRLTNRQKRVVQHLSGFYFLRMEVFTDTYEENHYPGHEKLASYPVWRATSHRGEFFDYYFVPWQASTDEEYTGLFIVEGGQ